MAQQHLRLGELLISSGLLRQDELRRALDHQQRVGGLLGTNLLEIDALGEKDLLRALGRQLSAPTVAVTDLVNIPEVVLARLPRATALDYHLLPFRLHGNTILIASMRPGDLVIEDTIQAQTQLMTRVHIGLEVRIWEALQRFYNLDTPVRVKRLLAKLNKERRSRNGRPLVPLGDPAVPLRRTGSVPPLIPPPVIRPPSIADEVLWQAIELDSKKTPAQPPRDSPLSPAEPPPVFPAPKSNPHSTAEVSVVVKPPRPESIDEAVEQLRTADRRERIAEIALDGSATLLKRRFLLAARGDRIIGWRGAGPGLERLRVHGLNFGPAESPIFLALANGAAFWLGPIVERPIHSQILDVFGGLTPPDCVVLPIRVRDKSVAYLYGDNGEDTIGGLPIDDLQRLADKTAAALVTYLYRKRHRAPDARIS